MIKVVLDANQFISALLRPKGKPAKILEFIRERKIRLLISGPIEEEIIRVLLYPRLQKAHRLSETEIREKMKNMTYLAETINPKITVRAIPDDPTDNKYLECAVEGKADFIISGDRHLTDLKEFQGIKIVPPAVFLEIFLSTPLSDSFS